MLKYLIIFQLLIFLSIQSAAQTVAPKSFDDEYPIAPQAYDEYGGKTQVAFQKDPIKGGSFSILSKIRKAKAMKKAQLKRKRLAKRKKVSKKKLKKKRFKKKLKKKRFKKKNIKKYKKIKKRKKKKKK